MKNSYSFRKQFKKLIAGTLTLCVSLSAGIALCGVDILADEAPSYDITLTVGESHSFTEAGATLSETGVVTVNDASGVSVITARKPGTVTVTVNGESSSVLVNAALKNGSVGGRPGGVTTNPKQPFDGVPEARVVRIPGILTLQNGDIFICSDMRYSDWNDGGGSDQMVTISHDNGNTWNYQFPIYFGDTTDNGNPKAATAVDPCCVQGNDGTIFLFTNVMSSGISNNSENGFIKKCSGRGFVEINGVQRLVLTGDWDDAFTNPSTDDGTAYPYYVGDLASNGYAPVMRRSDDTATQWAVDEFFNIYLIDNGEYLQMTQEQYTASEHNGNFVQQNVFFRDSVLHVYNTQYLWCASSTDNGTTWHHEILDYLKNDDETGIAVGCGHGIVVPDNGYIVVPMYRRYLG